MRFAQRTLHLALVGLIGLLSWPPSVVAQASKAGVVSTLQGSATVGRTSAAETTPLKFRDDVFVRDTIKTLPDSLARILLGGAALVTIRERSSLTIHDRLNTSTVDLGDGRIALSVVRARLKPGETIELRTRSAMATVRGTVVIAEVTPTATIFTLLKGVLEVVGLDPATGRPVGAPVTLNALQSVTSDNARGLRPPKTITPAEAEALAADFKVERRPVAAGPPVVTEAHVERAIQEAAGLIQGGDSLKSGVGTTTAPPRATVAPVIPSVAPPPPPPPSRGTSGQ